MPDVDLPRVKLYALGGTIAMVAGDDGVVPGLSGDALVAAVSGLDKLARIEAESVSTLASPNIRVASVIDLAGRIRRSGEAGGCDAFVVTQGTDTIEETAFLLDLLLAGFEHPVVVTGAMRHPLLVSADGAGNMLASVRAAVSPAVRAAAGKLGVLVVLNDTLHAAATVVKSNSHRPDAFGSPSTGPLGAVIEDRVVLQALPERGGVIAAGRLLKGCPPDAEAPVALLTATIGSTARLLEMLCEDGGHYRGVVVAAMGGGHVPERLVDSISRLAARLPLVLASRAGSGALLRNTYGFAGGEIDLLGRGAISAGWLHPLKAAVLLELLLRCGLSKDKVRQAFSGFDGAV